jgi:hypothetical protein
MKEKLKLILKILGILWLIYTLVTFIPIAKDEIEILNKTNGDFNSVISYTVEKYIDNNDITIDEFLQRSDD